jgi:hypothetical protein
MVQIRQGYRKDQPMVIVEVPEFLLANLTLLFQKFDLIKGILTRESPKLRLQLDKYFPVIEAIQKKQLLEQYSIQQSSIQFQKWKIQYRSKMISVSQEHQAPWNSDFGTSHLSSRLPNDQPFPPLMSPNHFIPMPDPQKKRNHSDVTPLASASFVSPTLGSNQDESFRKISAEPPEMVRPRSRSRRV